MNFLPRWFVLTVGATALVLWVSSFVATLFLPSYKPDPIIGWAAMAVVSACFTSQTIKAVADKLRKRIEGEEAKARENPSNARAPDSGVK